MDLPNPQKIDTDITRHYRRLGPNKRRELTRLVFEIAKREGRDYQNIIDGYKSGFENFHALRQALIQRRFPSLTKEETAACKDFSQLSLDARQQARLPVKFQLGVENIFVEKSVAHSELAQRCRKRFADARVKIIPSYREYIRGRHFDLIDYNRRIENLFIVRQGARYFQPCPCTKGAVGCGYQIFNLGRGCGYECVYCHLQGYVNSPGIVLPANIDDFFMAFGSAVHHRRLGTGEFTDSLLFDDLTNYASTIIEFMRRHPQTLFEFKTKSVNISGLLKTDAPANVIAAWSLNPNAVARHCEYLAPPVEERLAAAQRCVRAGYRVAFHFDPIIHYPGWEKDYYPLTERLLSDIPHAAIAWISLGALRMMPRLKNVIEKRFPNNQILDGELIPGFDHKLRYPFGLRLEIFRKMLAWLKPLNKITTVYLCMEDLRMHRALMMCAPNFKKAFANPETQG